MEPVQTTLPVLSAAPETSNVIAVFGAEDAEWFVSGLKDAAKGTGITIESVSGGTKALAIYEPKVDTVAIVYLSGNDQTLPQTKIPVYAFAANGRSVSSGIPCLGYDGSGAAKLVLENAIAYPPHLAPVRMIGLFTSDASPVYTLWTEQKTAAQVFSKDEFFVSSTELPLADWLREAFTRYYPGMLDAVFAETGELAIAAADALASLGRDDVEVFSAGTDADVLQKLSPILVCATGADLKRAGALCFAEANNLFSGEQPQSNLLFPESFWHDDTK
ncbi:MAG: hypothetical protein C0413_04240 [Clostridiales bacterium]|nr:hypothetical protein [Clostridiales bacterium]